MTNTLLKCYIKEAIIEESYSNNLLLEGKIYDWFKKKFKDAYSYFVYDKELVDMCVEWLEKNKYKQSKSANKRRDNFKNIVNSQENKRTRFLLVATGILMTLAMNLNNLTRNEEGFSQAYQAVSDTLNDNSERSYKEDNIDDDFTASNNSNITTSKHRNIIKSANRKLIDLSDKEQSAVLSMFGVVETEDSFFDLISNNNFETFDNMSSESFSDHINTVNNLLQSGRLIDEKEIDDTFKMLINATSSNKGITFRKEINDAYTDLSNYKIAINTIANISNAAETSLNVENEEEFKEKCDTMFNEKISAFEEQIQKELESDIPESKNVRLKRLRKIMQNLYNEYDKIF